MDDVIELQRRNRFGDLESGDMQNGNDDDETVLKKKCPTWDPIKEEQVTGVVVSKSWRTTDDISLSETDSSIVSGTVTKASQSGPV